MKITRTSMFTGIERTLDIPITEAQLGEWQEGGLIQEVAPNLTPTQCEFIMTGITDEEWNEEFEEDEEDLIGNAKGTAAWPTIAELFGLGVKPRT